MCTNDFHHRESAGMFNKSFVNGCATIFPPPSPPTRTTYNDSGRRKKAVLLPGHVLAPYPSPVSQASTAESFATRHMPPGAPCGLVSRAGVFQCRVHQLDDGYRHEGDPLSLTKNTPRRERAEEGGAVNVFIKRKTTNSGRKRKRWLQPISHDKTLVTHEPKVRWGGEGSCTCGNVGYGNDDKKSRRLG